jgi:SAM-dependent methyltransferase
MATLGQMRRHRRDPAERRTPPAPIGTRHVADDRIPEGGGVEDFDTDAARAINEARLGHLESLGLPLSGRCVLDVGGGVGHLARFFVERACDVVSTDARSENVARMHELYPSLAGHVLDVETDDLESLGRFDVVFCYGLLYHLENPLLALCKLTGVCDSLLLIETMICDSLLPILRLDDETLSLNQALRGLAHRPSPTYVAMALDRMGMQHVYAPVEPPDHPDYQVEPLGDLAFEREGHLLRAVFVAAREPLDNDRLDLPTQA